ncbi:MAG: ABC transporter ATP-binding protein [Rhodanobacteraceae bacterium]
MPHLETRSLARLADVVKNYGEQRALDHIDLTLRSGEILALLGPNGAGKTTAVSLLLGLIRPDTGRATLFDQPPSALSARRRIGVMLQSAGLPDTLTVLDLITLTRSYYPNPLTVADTASLAGINDLLARRYGKLSGGQQRRVQFALALCGRPDVMFLDEPTTGLDIEARQMLWAAIRSRIETGCAVMLTTHYLEEAEALADQVMVLANGRAVAEGSVQEVRSRVSQRRVRCISSLSLDGVRTWREVRSAERQGDRLEIITDSAEAVVRQLLFEDSALQELEVQRAGLAEAFVELTREAA